MSAIFSVYHKPELLFSYFFVETNLRGCQVSTVFTAKKLVSIGRGCMEPLPGVFDMLQYFEKIFSRVESLKMSYILRVVALLEACDVTRNDRSLGFHHEELEIRLKPREW